MELAPLQQASAKTFPTSITLHPTVCNRSSTTAFCKEAMGHCKEALTIYAAIIADSPLSPGTSTVIFRTSVLLAHVGRFDEVSRSRSRAIAEVLRREKYTQDSNKHGTKAWKFSRARSVGVCFLVFTLASSGKVAHAPI